MGSTIIEIGQFSSKRKDLHRKVQIWKKSSLASAVFMTDSIVNNWYFFIKFFVIFVLLIWCYKIRLNGTEICSFSYNSLFNEWIRQHAKNWKSDFGIRKSEFRPIFIYRKPAFWHRKFDPHWFHSRIKRFFLNFFYLIEKFNFYQKNLII